MADYILSKLKETDKKKILLAGDRIYTDMKLGNILGVTPFLFILENLKLVI